MTNLPMMIMKSSSNYKLNNALINFAKDLGYTIATDFPSNLTEGYISFGTSKKSDINYKSNE